MSRFTKDVAAVWQGGTAFRVTAGSGHALLTDGTSQAAQSPMELILSGLAGCIGADVMDILRKKRQDVTGVEIRVHGERSEAHPRVYNNLELVFQVTGRKVDPEAVRRAIELSEHKYCSVSAMLRATAQMVCRYEIREAEPLQA
jgi:putative redox protein